VESVLGSEDMLGRVDKILGLIVGCGAVERDTRGRELELERERER
jgi:hypothetical protein